MEGRPYKYILTPLTVHPIYDGNVCIGNLARDFKWKNKNKNKSYHLHRKISTPIGMSFTHDPMRQ